MGERRLRPSSGTGRQAHVLVVTRCERLAALPSPEPSATHRVRPLDLGAPEELATWLEVHNQAFGRRWVAEDHHAAFQAHPIVRVLQTFAAVGPDGRVDGVASIGVFRGNEQVGLGHYLCVRPGVQGSGVGRLLVTHRYQALAAVGVTAIESQTHVSRTASLRLHFDCGFVPKYRLDPWNTPDRVGPVRRQAASLQFWWAWRRWQADRRSRPAGSPIGSGLR